MTSPVAAVPAASSDDAFAHFSRKFTFDTDCWDVHESIRIGKMDFVLLDVRGPQLYEKEHVPGALNLPHGKITANRMSEWPEETLFVVYCAGPHCNGADRAAVRLSQLGRPVKLMTGGMCGWADEGFAFAKGAEPGSVSEAAA